MAIGFEAGHRRYALVIHISKAALTLAAILQMLEKRKVVIDSLHMECFPGPNATVYMHCFMHREKFRQNMNLVNAMDDVFDTEWLESHS